MRFLAWCVLDKDIQADTHDSIEDAQTALALFKKYLEVKKLGKFDSLMDEIYKQGTLYNFRPPGRKRVASSEFLI